MTATTVYEKIEKLKTIKDDLKTNIESYGVTVGTAPFDEYPAKVLEIPTTDSVKTLIDAVNEESGGAAIQDSIDLVESNYTDIKAAITAAGVDMTGVKPSGYDAKIADVAVAAKYPALFRFYEGRQALLIYCYNSSEGSLDVVIPASIRGVDVLQLDTYAFYSAEGLPTINSVYIPNIVTTMGANAFTGQTTLTSVRLPINASFTTISPGAFQSCALAEIDMPVSVTTILQYAFLSCPLIKITIGSGVTISNTDVGNSTMGTYGADFITLYNGNGKLAGTYEYAGGTWTKTA